MIVHFPLLSRDPVPGVMPSCDPSYDQELLKQWKTMCKRAVALLRKGHSDECGRDCDHGCDGDGSLGTDNDCNGLRDTKGHDICLTSCGRFAYCSQCYITRCFRDAKYIAVKTCGPVDRPKAREGERVDAQGHDAVLEMAVWKKGSKRPQFHCKRYDKRWWATTRPRECTA